jgi:undecaprenyl pyrophosphate phosphatase UppP
MNMNMTKKQVLELISFLLIMMLSVGLLMLDLLTWGLAIEKIGMFGVAAGLIVNAVVGLYVMGRFINPSKEGK